MEKKIVGFKLIKYYPGCAVPINYKGCFISSAQSNNYGSLTWNGCGSLGTTEELLKWPEFWDPIYEEEKVISVEKIINQNSPYCANIGLHDLVKLMRAMATETIDFMIDYLNDNDVRHGQTSTDWKSELKKKIK